MDETATQ